MIKIDTISFPNTVKDEDQTNYSVQMAGIKIKRIMKSGEMSGICWFEVSRDGKVIAEIKESVCNIYYE